MLIIGLLVFIAINFEGAFPFQPMFDGFDKELNHVTTSHTALVSDPFGRFYLDVLMRETTWPALAGCVLLVVWLLIIKRRIGIIDAVLLVFPFAYAVLLTQAAVHFDRYLLPTVVGVQLAGGVGLAVIVQALLRKLEDWWPTSPRPQHREHSHPSPAVWRSCAVSILAVALAVIPGTFAGLRASMSCINQFADDSRDRLNDWLVNDLEPGSHLTADDYAKVDKAALRQAGHRTITRGLDFGRYSLDDLRRWGVTHVVVCNLRYDRYLNEYRSAAPGREDYIARQVTGYRRLFHEGQIVWQSTPERAMPYYVNPTVTVYRIDRPTRSSRAFTDDLRPADDG